MKLKKIHVLFRYNGHWPATAYHETCIDSRCGPKCHPAPSPTAVPASGGSSDQTPNTFIKSLSDTVPSSHNLPKTLASPSTLTIPKSKPFKHSCCCYHWGECWCRISVMKDGSETIHLQRHLFYLQQIYLSNAVFLLNLAALLTFLINRHACLRVFVCVPGNFQQRCLHFQITGSKRAKENLSTSLAELLLQSYIKGANSLHFSKRLHRTMSY